MVWSGDLSNIATGLFFLVCAGAIIAIFTPILLVSAYQLLGRFAIRPSLKKVLFLFIIAGLVVVAVVVVCNPWLLAPALVALVATSLLALVTQVVVVPWLRRH